MTVISQDGHFYHKYNGEGIRKTRDKNTDKWVLRGKFDGIEYDLGEYENKEDMLNTLRRFRLIYCNLGWTKVFTF